MEVQKAQRRKRSSVAGLRSILKVDICFEKDRKMPFWLMNPWGGLICKGIKNVKHQEPFDQAKWRTTSLMLHRKVEGLPW